MATVKRKASGKIILKNGKVSCGCCAQAGCCMYPAQALLNGQYKAVDLPEIIVWSNAESGAINYNKITNQAVQGLQVYYLAEGSPPIGSGDENIVGINEDEYQWVRWTGGSIGGPGMCLISSQVGGDEFIDQFADTYTATFISPSGAIRLTATLTRVSVCRWEGEVFDPTYIPDYFYPTTYSIAVYLGELGMPVNPDDPYLLDYVWAYSISDRTDGIKGRWEGPQNTPVGHYGDAAVYLDFTVS